MRIKARSMATWAQDRIFRRVLRNSGYLFASQAISTLMAIITARLLGVDGFGELGIITVFASTINRLLSFRMADVVVRYMGEFVTRKEPDRAAAVVKAAMLVEGLTSIIAYLVLVLLAPLAARIFIKDDPGATPLLILYGLSILGNITTETATGVLQVTNHYRSQALVTLLQSFLVAGILTYGYFTHAGLLVVVMAYLIGKMVLGLGPIALALYHLNRLFGPGWWRAPLDLLPPRREIVHFAVSTNLSGTINTIVRDSELLWVGYFFNSTQVGYYKLAMAVINMVVLPITPFVSTTYPEINKAVIRREWARLRLLLRRVSTVAGLWTGAVAVGLLLVGRQVLFQPWVVFGHALVRTGFSLFKPEFLPAYPAILVLLIGFGTANILIWNRSLLLVLGLPDYPLRVSVWATLAKVGLTFVIVPMFGPNGYIAEAALLSAYLIVTVGLIVWRGLTEVRRAEMLEPAGAPG